MFGTLSIFDFRPKKYQNLGRAINRQPDYRPGKTHAAGSSTIKNAIIALIQYIITISTYMYLIINQISLSKILIAYYISFCFNYIISGLD